ncbi:helix-turn-helix domain-containing protein [Psychromicrobium xiongbiense]|uniref:helix-turn-helix domain-containing protein n=1 Tax=Psychromicrobium xiongbiense TaxID=3051184 RepID=UPI00255263D1|nr:XRE family transcriptional regulator [Psychromicrobium sp. YIM S02556]
MDEEAESLARVIGERVRQERKAREWTLDHLSDAAGVSRRMVVNVEQGSVNPSIGTLLRLSEALGVGLPALVEPPASQAAKVTRHHEGAVLWAGPSGGQGVLMAGTEPPNVLELWDWTLAAGERHESEAHTAGTRELLQVQQGWLMVETDGQTVELGAGDALTFFGDTVHAYTNPRDESARFLLAVYEPGVGNAHTREQH